jgi:hypothetical protein
MSSDEMNLTHSVRGKLLEPSEATNSEKTSRKIPTLRTNAIDDIPNSSETNPAKTISIKPVAPELAALMSNTFFSVFIFVFFNDVKVLPGYFVTVIFIRQLITI